MRISDWSSDVCSSDLIAHLDDALGVDPAPGDAHGFVANDRGGGLGDGHRGLPYSAAAERLAAAWLRATSKASKLRSRQPARPRTGRFTTSGTRCSLTPPWERSGPSRPERSGLSGRVPTALAGAVTTTSHPKRGSEGRRGGKRCVGSVHT